MAGPHKAMLSGHAIEVLKTLKANGENTQISYIKEYDMWIVASKNVSIALRKESDIECYIDESADKSRYSFAKLMAKKWFEKVSELEKEGLLSGLKEDIDGKTMVGEYIGNKEF